MKVQKPQFKPGLENRSASFALSACYTATMILRKSVTHTGKKIRILVRCSCSKTASDTDFLYTLQGKKIPEKKTTTRSGEHRTLRSGRNSVPGYPLSPLGRHPVPGYPLSPLEGGTQFRGAAFSSGAEPSSGVTAFSSGAELSSASPSPDCRRNTALRAVSFAPFKKRVQGDAKTP